MTNNVQDMDLEVELDDIMSDTDADNYDNYAKGKTKLSARKQIDEYLAEKELAKLLGDYDDDLIISGHKK